LVFITRINCGSVTLEERMMAIVPII